MDMGLHDMMVKALIGGEKLFLLLNPGVDDEGTVFTLLPKASYLASFDEYVDECIGLYDGNGYNVKPVEGMDGCVYEQIVEGLDYKRYFGRLSGEFQKQMLLPLKEA